MKNFWQHLLDLSRDQESDSSLSRVLPFYRDFSPRQQQWLTDNATQRNYLEEEFIFKEGEPALAIYFVLQGSVGLFKKSPDKEMERYRCETPGEFFGEESVFGHTQRLFFAKALENTQLLSLTKADFDRLMKTHSKAALIMLQYLSGKIYFQFTSHELELHELTKRLTQAKIIV